MSAQRNQREARALAFLKTRGTASAIEIGSAAVSGESWSAPRNTAKAREIIGVQIAVGFMKQGLVRPTRSNHFEFVA